MIKLFFFVPQAKAALTRAFNKSTHLLPYATVTMGKLRSKKANPGDGDIAAVDPDVEDANGLFDTASRDSSDDDLQEDAMISVSPSILIQMRSLIRLASIFTGIFSKSANNFVPETKGERESIFPTVIELLATDTIIPGVLYLKMLHDITLSTVVLCPRKPLAVQASAELSK